MSLYKGDVLLPNEVIEEIRLGTDLVKLIGETVSLKRSGTNYTGRCPFHDEKTPSFSVSPSKQLYHCFGCGEGGTAITFVMKYFHLPFIDALERLAERLRIDLSKYQQKQNSEQIEHKKKMFDVVSYAAEKFHNVLQKPLAKSAVEYLTTKRGLTKATIEEFKLGFAPDGWDHMLTALQRDKKSLEIATQTGILAKRQRAEGLYDVFRNRIMVPIQNPKGNLVGFGGRSFGDEQPKYLNSPQSEIFDKSRLLFGLSQAEKTIREKDQVFLVEGYFDQMALYQYGFKNVVATLGTALTEQHAELLKRYTDHIVVVFDGDKAGLAASKRSMSALLSNGFEAKIVRVPQGQDPDSFVREKGANAFEMLVQNARSLSDEIIEISYTRETDLQKKAEFLEDLSNILQKTKNLYYQEVLLDDFSNKTGVEKNRLLQPSLREVPKPMKKNPISKVSDHHGNEFTLLRLFLEAPSYRKRFVDEDVLAFFPLDDFSDAAKSWIDFVKTNAKENELNVSSFLDQWPLSESRSEFAKIMMGPWKTDDEYFEKTFSDCLLNLKKRKKSSSSSSVLREQHGNKKDEEIAEQINRLYKQ